MAEKQGISIHVVLPGTNTVRRERLSSRDDCEEMLKSHCGKSLMKGIETIRYDGLKHGETCELELADFVDEREKKRSKTTHREIVFSGTEDNKKSLPPGELADRFGGLLDRESSKQQLYEGLLQLAKKVGLKSLDKKDVPLLGISGGTESGKTEFLKWIFTHCCTFSPRQKKAMTTLQAICFKR